MPATSLFSRGCFLCMGLFSIFLFAETWLAGRVARLVAIGRPKPTSPYPIEGASDAREDLADVLAH
jgi:hypothetical protein